MQTFHYLPPGAEEQRTFVVQFVGTLAGVVLLVALSFAVQGAARSVLWGGGVAMIWLLARAAWQLEKKARRSSMAEIGVADDGLHLTDDTGQVRIVAWPQISACDVTGGRLRVLWPDGQLLVGAREVQDGMDMVRAVLQKTGGSLPSDEAADEGGFKPPSNFIPLDPR